MLLLKAKGPPVPISRKRLAANRANAAQSTGPNTPDGKTRSAQNAIKHGFTASSFVVVRIEDLQEIAHLKEDLVAFYQPENSQEMVAIERMALAQQSIYRAQRLESGLLTAALNETLDTNGRPFTPMSSQLAGEGDMDITRAQNRNYCLAEGFLRQIRQSNGWSLFLRYQAQSERLYRRALEEFERLQSLRPLLPSGTVSVSERPGTVSVSEQPGTASASERPGTVSVSERPGTASVSERPGTVSVSERPGTASVSERPQPDDSPATSPFSQTNPPRSTASPVAAPCQPPSTLRRPLSTAAQPSPPIHFRIQSS
jgi:hypothetical protein